MAVQTSWIRNTDGSSPYTFATNPNSAKVQYPAGSSLTDLMDTVQYVIVGTGYNSGTPSSSTGPQGGWELWDAAAGTNMRGYRAFNFDGVSYKSVNLDYNTSGYIILRVYEDWNPATHGLTNEVYTTFGASTSYAQRTDLTNGGSLYVFSTAHWLVLQSQVTAGIGGSTNNTFISCIEITRDNPEDTVVAGIPCWVWASGHGIWSYASGPAVWMPRTVTNAMGSNGGGFVISDFGTRVTSGALSAIPMGTNPWTSKYQASTMRLGYGTANIEIKGRFCGLKLLTGNAGAFMDNATLKCDSNFFLSNTGTNTPHNIVSESAGRFAIPM